MGANWIGRWRGGRVRMDTRGDRTWVIERQVNGKRHTITTAAVTDEEALVALEEFEESMHPERARLRAKAAQIGFSPAGPSVVYFVRCGAAIKIGISTNVEARVASLRTSSAARLDLLGFVPGGRDEETRLHRHFARLRMQGEWFRATPELLEFIRLALQEVAA